MWCLSGDAYFVTLGGMSFNGGGRTLRSEKVSSPFVVPAVEISGELSRRLVDGRLLLTVEGPAGRAVVVVVVVGSSSDLTEWTEITLNPNDSGEFEAYDASPDGIGPPVPFPRAIRSTVTQYGGGSKPATGAGTARPQPTANSSPEPEESPDAMLCHDS